MSRNATSASTVVNCLVGQGVEFQGDVIFSDGMHVDGVVNGNISAREDRPSRLTIGENGTVEGNIKVSDAELSGTIKGDVYAAGTLVLHEKTSISGNVYYNRIEIKKGAEVNGKLISLSQRQGVQHPA